MIEFRNVTKYYARVKVLDDVSFTVEEGTQTGLLGPGGAGKSLLIKIAAGLVRADEGEVYVEGKAVGTMDPVELSTLRLRIGMLFQNYALFDYMTVEENIAFPLRQEGEQGEEAIRERVANLLEQVDLSGIQMQYPRELSGGMKKRVTFARAIARTPPILLYDDPTAGLDPVTSGKIFVLLEKMRTEEGVTSIVITHDVIGVRDICDRFVVMDKGKMLFHGTREEIEASEIRLVRQFWDGTSDE